MRSLFVTILLLSSFFVHADIFEDISTAVKAGNAKAIGRYINNSVDLSILNQEEIYSKDHAEQLLQDFFQKNPPGSFTIIHQGSKEGSKFAIGKMVSKAGVSFRFYIFIRQSSSGESIQELRIEKE
jgi:hypothetical protein